MKDGKHETGQGLRKVLAHLLQYFLPYYSRYFTLSRAVMITCVEYLDIKITATALSDTGRIKYVVCPGDIGIEYN